MLDNHLGPPRDSKIWGARIIISNSSNPECCPLPEERNPVRSDAQVYYYVRWESLLTDGDYRVLIYANNYVPHFTLRTLPIVLCSNRFCYCLSQKRMVHLKYTHLISNSMLCLITLLHSLCITYKQTKIRRVQMPISCRAFSCPKFAELNQQCGLKTRVMPAVNKHDQFGTENGKRKQPDNARIKVSVLPGE